MMPANLPRLSGDDAGLLGLARHGWGWEFLRRNSDYQEKFRLNGLDAADSTSWGLLRYEDPSVDARHASVFWSADDCPSVLRLTAVRDTGHSAQVPFELGHIACRIEFHHSDSGDTSNVLFVEDGRFLQLSIAGARDLKGTHLFMPALDVAENVTVRAASFRRLNDLMQHGHLRRALYPLEPRAPRLLNVLKALDGSLARLPHREIALLMFSKDRVDADWGGRQHHLRDQVRRAIAYGQGLMDGGYRQFLRPTYSRQIARPGAPRG
jgi:hypothetical protein